MDLKAAFDLVNRGVLVRAIKKKGIRKGLTKKVEKVLRETKSRVRAGGEMGENFGRLEE